MFGLVANNCPVCGKEFFPKYGWAYKREGIKYCSWTCLRRATKDEKKPELHVDDPLCRPKKNSWHVKVVQQLNKEKNVIATFKGAEEVADILGHNAECVRQACRSGNLYKGCYWRYKV